MSLLYHKKSEGVKKSTLPSEMLDYLRHSHDAETFYTKKQKL